MNISFNQKRLGFIWQLDNIDNELEIIFDFLNKNYIYFGISDGHWCNSFFNNLQYETMDKAKKFLHNYFLKNFSNINKMNVIVDITRNSMKDMYEKILLLFLSKCQDVEIFSKISWRGNVTTGYGNESLFYKEKADWENIITIVNKSKVGNDLLPIKAYLKGKIEYCDRGVEEEKKLRFLEQS